MSTQQHTAPTAPTNDQPQPAPTSAETAAADDAQTSILAAELLEALARHRADTDPESAAHALKAAEELRGEAAATAARAGLLPPRVVGALVADVVSRAAEAAGAWSGREGRRLGG